MERPAEMIRPWSIRCPNLDAILFFSRFPSERYCGQHRFSPLHGTTSGLKRRSVQASRRNPGRREAVRKLRSRSVSRPEGETLRGQKTSIKTAGVRRRSALTNSANGYQQSDSGCKNGFFILSDVVCQSFVKVISSSPNAWCSLILYFMRF